MCPLLFLPFIAFFGETSALKGLPFHRPVLSTRIFPLVILTLFCLLIILILVTFTLKIFSIFFFKLVLFAPAGTLKTILFCSDKFVDFSVTIRNNFIV